MTAPAPARRPRPWLPVTIAVVVAALIAAVVIVAMNTAGPGTAASGDPVPGMNTPTANLLALNLMDGSPAVRAPSYRLTNEDGTTLTPQRFRGRAVVLTFNDDRCTDLCALFAQDLVAADRDLGTTARAHTAFVAINANPYHPSTADVRAWSAQHGLGALPNWYYGTGDAATLARTAAAFGVPIELDPKTRTVAHGTEIFVIAPDGTEVAQAQFGTEDADTAPFAHGLALLANAALPAADRGPVGGHDLPAPLAGGTGIGDTPAPLSGTALGGAAALTSARGRFTVVDFWSSSCTACATQLPDMQAESRATAGRVAFLGVDVDDTTAAGLAEVRRAGVRFASIADTTGGLAARFRVTGLPYTVILDPHGTVLVRHPGVFTRAELDYVLHGVDPALPAT